MAKKRRTYLPRIVGSKVMMPADLKRLCFALLPDISWLVCGRVAHETGSGAAKARHPV